LHDRRRPKSNAASGFLAASIEGSCAALALGVEALIASSTTLAMSVIGSLSSVFLNDGNSSSSTEHFWVANGFYQYLRFAQFICKKWKQLLKIYIETESYLDIAEVDIVILKKAYEVLEIFFSWEVMTAVWPYSL